jgi:hypothetical protein
MKPADSMLPGEWRVLLSVFAHVTKVFGGDYEAALKEIKRVLADGQVRAMVRPLTDNKGHELPVEFWQTHMLSSVGPNHIIVVSKEYPPKDHRYFLRQRDVEKVWPANSQATTAGNETLPPWPRKSSAGAKGKVDWEIILIEAASHMYEEGLPKSLTELCTHIENSFAGVTPGKTQLEIHLGPLYRKFSKVDGK